MFKRYDNSGLACTAMESKHVGECIGLFETVLAPEKYAARHSSQQSPVSGLGHDNCEMPKTNHCHGVLGVISWWLILSLLVAYIMPKL